VPEAYALARVQFRRQAFAKLVFLLPLMVRRHLRHSDGNSHVKVGLAGTFEWVILANLVPALPSSFSVMTPFIEQNRSQSRSSCAHLRC